MIYNVLRDDIIIECIIAKFGCKEIDLLLFNKRARMWFFKKKKKTVFFLKITLAIKECG